MAGVAEDVFLHGTTAATNALLEERGARVALVTDAGYEDVIEIARQDRPSLYDSFADRPRPLVAREQRLGFDGDADALLAALSAAEPGRWSPSRSSSRTQTRVAEVELEQPMRRGAAGAGPALVAVSPEFREYERTATTVLSAYLTPSVAGYLASLEAAACPCGGGWS